MVISYKFKLKNNTKKLNIGHDTLEMDSKLKVSYLKGILGLKTEGDVKLLFAKRC